MMKKKNEEDFELDNIELELSDIDHSRLIKENVELVKCDKCNTFNVKGVRKCIKCGTQLDRSIKSCPKCAKYNNVRNLKCDNCGYKFSRKYHFFKSLIISLLVVIVLLIATYIKGETLEYEMGLKIVGGLLVIAIIGNSLFSNKGAKEILSAEEVIQGQVKRKKIFSFIGILVILVLVATLIYFIYFHK